MALSQENLAMVQPFVHQQVAGKKVIALTLRQELTAQMVQH